MRWLSLRNFRLYENAQFAFSPALNVIRGANARGKTTLLEAISFLMCGRSFRTAQTSALMRSGAAYFQIEALFVKYGIEQHLQIYCSSKERKISYNHTPTPALALFGLLQGVVMHPEDISSIKGAPALRRQLLNLQLAQSDPLYVHCLSRYEQAMRQRNALLRAGRVETIESWEYEMSRAAAYLILKRAEMVAELEVLGGEYYRLLCEGLETLSLLYKPHGASGFLNLDLETLQQRLYEQYRKHRKREMAFGTTLIGPQKDDFAIFLNEKEVRLFASEGQQRSAAAALRLAEWQRLEQVSKELPLMLIDDFGLSLDSVRRAALMNRLKGMQQIFITTTDQQALAENENSICL